MTELIHSRSGVKLLSMGGANSDLSVTLSEVKNMRTSAKAFMSAQNLGKETFSDLVKVLINFLVIWQY